MMRFAEFLARFASVLVRLGPEEVNAVRAAWRRAVAAIEDFKRGLAPGTVPPAPPNLEAFFAGLPPTLMALGGEFRQAVAREVAYRGPTWAHGHLLDAISNFVPTLNEPYERSESPTKPDSPGALGHTLV